MAVVMITPPSLRDERLGGRPAPKRTISGPSGVRQRLGARAIESSVGRRLFSPVQLWPMSLKPGTRFGPYELLALLGAGGMGEVYRARDTRLGRQVAVKVIPRTLAGDRRRVKRFELEARATGALNHPNIVAIFDVGSHRGTRFVVMELADGQTLREILKQEGALPVRDALDYAAQAVEGLEAAHAAGIVHRDLTPGNLMVGRDGRVKILDFGLAKLVANETRSLHGLREETSITEEGTVAGTVPSRAPEQVRGEGVDARTDLFALGILLYEMVTGRRRVVGQTVADVASAILSDPPVPARAIRLDLPGDIDRVIGRCLEKDPADRYKSAREVGDQLKRAARRLDEEAGNGTRAVAELPGSSGSLEGSLFRAPAAPSIAVLPFANRTGDDRSEERRVGKECRCRWS